jgi:putative restriction endonuclease
MPPHFGAIAGVPPGTIFESRAALAAAGVHRPRLAGICGRAGEGAESIVISGGYEDDRDEGDTIIYTGWGGNDRKTGRQIADQELRLGNAALVKSYEDGLPIRVTRGAGLRSPHSPPFGYGYAGLYRVADYWCERGRSGFLVWRFRLVRIMEKAGVPA